MSNGRGGDQSQKLEPLTRDVAEANADALLSLSADMTWESWTRENLLLDLPEKWQRSRVVFEDSSPIAYAITSRKAKSVHCHHLVVGPSHRGLGLGDKLLSDAIQQARA